MKPKIFTSVLLFFSAYSPLFVIIGVKDFDFGQTYWFMHPLAMYIVLGLTLLSIFLLCITIKGMNRGNMLVEVVSVKHRSNDLINYTIPYMVAFFGVDLSKQGDIISICIFLSIMLLLTITTKSIFINPILAIVGYEFYDIEYKYDNRTKTVSIISKHELHPTDKCYVRSLTRFLYFTKEREQDVAK
jgi:hypothetical protein